LKHSAGHWTRVTRGATFRSKGQGQGHWKRKYKIVFLTYLRQKWIDLRQTKTKMSSGSFYTYRQVHFTSEMLRLCDNL